MKKVLIVLAFVAVYGVSLAMTQTTPMVSVDETIVVVDDNVEKEEGKKAKAKSEAKADGKACAGEKSAKKSDCSSKCAGEKSAKKSNCSTSCSDKK